MKKIIGALLVMIFLSSSFSFGGGTNCIAGDCDTPPAATNNTSNSTPAATNNTSPEANAPAGQAANSTPAANTTTPSPTEVMGISCKSDQLVNGQCKLNIYDMLGIRKSVRNEGDPTSVGLFVQDIVLSATMFIGTLVTIALIVSGIMFILAATSGKDPANAKNGIIGSLIGLLLVVSSYVIIRLVQYIAKGF